MMLAHKNNKQTNHTLPNQRNLLQFPAGAFYNRSDNNNNANNDIADPLQDQQHHHSTDVINPGEYEHPATITFLKCNRSDCDKTVTSRQELISHLRKVHNTARPFQCHASTCKDSFLSETKLVEHCRDFHQTDNGWISCTKCSRYFETLEHLKVHILMCYYSARFSDETPNDSSNSYSPASSSTSSPDGREYVCEYAKCGERFQTRQLLDRHQKYHYGLKPHRNGGHWNFKNDNYDMQNNDSSQLSPPDASKLAGRKRFYRADDDAVSNDSNYGMQELLRLNLSNDASSIEAFSKPNSPDSKCSQEIVTPMTSDDDDEDDESFYGDYTEADLLGAKLSDDDKLRWCLNLPQRKSRLQFFWQYNSHSKRVKECHRSASEEKSFEEENPYIFKEITDPVFSGSGDCSSNFRYNGKIRKCDGNDWTPNPKKLLMIGLELKKLTDAINTLNVRSSTSDHMAMIRKEKNKLTSRICRLKKKAQNEANKIKLYGLLQEHAKLIKVFSEIRGFLLFSAKELDNGSKVDRQMNITIDESLHLIQFPSEVPSFLEIISKHFKPGMDVAGDTTSFVNYTLDSVAKGQPDGGMSII